MSRDVRLYLDDLVESSNRILEYLRFLSYSLTFEKSSLN